MLRPAQLYEDELRTKHIETWYRPEYMYYDGDVGDSIADLPADNYNKHCFVSVNEDDEIIGFITYNVSYLAMSADGFAIISFDRGNMLFIKDVYTAICNIFDMYRMNRLSFYCFADNPAIKAYRQFIKRHGGTENGCQHELALLRDGKLHDEVSFEIMARDFRK